jgi:hypothetical protein
VVEIEASLIPVCVSWLLYIKLASHHFYISFHYLAAVV